MHTAMKVSHCFLSVINSCLRLPKIYLIVNIHSNDEFQKSSMILKQKKKKF